MLCCKNYRIVATLIWWKFDSFRHCRYHKSVIFNDWYLDNSTVEKCSNWERWGVGGGRGCHMSPLFTLHIVPNLLKQGPYQILKLLFKFLHVFRFGPEKCHVTFLPFLKICSKKYSNQCIKLMQGGWFLWRKENKWLGLGNFGRWR